MESLRFTQFAHLAPNTQGLPRHVADKLEKAIVDAHLKKSKDLKKSYEEKMKKAQQLREERLSMKTVKAILECDKVKEVQQRKVLAPEEQKELYSRILETKMQIAELRALQHKQKQLLKAQEMGTTGVQRAQKRREMLNAMMD